MWIAWYNWNNVYRFTYKNVDETNYRKRIKLYARDKYCLLFFKIKFNLKGLHSHTLIYPFVSMYVFTVLWKRVNINYW